MTRATVSRCLFPSRLSRHLNVQVSVRILGGEDLPGRAESSATLGCLLAFPPRIAKALQTLLRLCMIKRTYIRSLVCETNRSHGNGRTDPRKYGEPRIGRSMAVASEEFAILFRRGRNIMRIMQSDLCKNRREILHAGYSWSRLHGDDGTVMFTKDEGSIMPFLGSKVLLREGEETRLRSLRRASSTCRTAVVREHVGLPRTFFSLDIDTHIAQE